MMYKDFIKNIVNSEPKHWIYDDEVGSYVFKKDIRITMKQDKTDNEEFDEEWVKNFIHHPTATRMIVDLCFNGNSIEKFYTAAVDGERMYIPYPNSEMKITYKQYKIGRLINVGTCNVMDRYDEYLITAEISSEKKEPDNRAKATKRL
ncbi:hypothetical protein GOQ29_05090 [Clostridium sp. D2Q-14]|uniref:hypothetical protein n=1 Tax=Anaeromonas gelatinilytica TaxID=2683194 RepID=UPI00193BBA5C|nr:hypothetical protein [Anaeromonas gelatinilytica]MBS4534992.1 hypothetical protein [Anaeromonas gelatinilytica]